MALIKLTEDIVKAIGISRESTIDKIHLYERTEGKEGIPGKVDAKTIWIDESAVPEALRPKPKIDLPDTEASRYMAEAEKIKAEVQKIRAEIDLEIARGEHDKPEKLKVREQTIEEREAEVATKLKDVNAKLSELKNREDSLQVLEAELLTRRKIIEQDCATQLKTTQETIAKTEANFEEYSRKQYAQIDDLNDQIKKETAKLDGLLDVISQYPEAIDPWIVALKKYKRLCDGLAVREYKNADSTNGEISDRHTALANQGWSLSKGFEKLIMWFTGS